MDGLLTLTFDGFPEGYCYPGDPTQFAEDLISYTNVEFNSETNNLYYNFGGTEPDADDRIYPWLRTSGDYLDGWFWWDDTAAAWVRTHPVPTDSDERRIFVGTTTDLETYDGGSAGAVTDYTGPMWQVDTNFAGRFPLGVGTIAGNPYTVGGTGGDDGVTITGAMLDHTHQFGYAIALPNYPQTAMFYMGASTANPAQNAWVVNSDFGLANSVLSLSAANLATLTADMGTPDEIPIEPPLIAVYFIKRTDREYYVI